MESTTNHQNPKANELISGSTIDTIYRDLGICLRPKYKAWFLNRGYQSTEKLPRALTRYKVFGDLGYVCTED